MRTCGASSKGKLLKTDREMALRQATLKEAFRACLVLVKGQSLRRLFSLRRVHGRQRPGFARWGPDC